ncbi:hypothetical protein LTR05_003559 [Lithohypha guttulata]|uniref:Uncharacterized protein n=1 Tax=Lithohypha guttulata TaxID=1690604 RepID=A0AAN7T065_9EURO|nr:hypothetical protein LTR05_003559 [Lithohypha guttulata]
MANRARQAIYLVFFVTSVLGTDSPICSLVNYGGIFRSGGFGPSASLPDYCFNAGYGGPLIPTPEPTDAGLPCCPICYPASNNTAIITSGVLSTTGPITTPTRRPGGNGGGVIGSGIGGDGDGSTITVTDITIEPEITITRTTLSVETITPPADPTVSIVPDTIIGCGTASGCGTVVGNGTVYLAPFGFPAVTSVGTVTGCAPTVIGCGTMIATTGTFTGTADVSACGEGTGCATMIGTGTVWPAGFMDMISFVSSGTVTGCGRVKGCGVLTGTGTFTVSEPFTTTIQPSPTVNVYVSYCPPDPAVQNPLMRLAGNISDPDAYLRYAISPTLAGGSNYTQLNSTGNSTSLANTLCRVCPEDAGICCPPFTDCGADGHCPWNALEGCGYAMFGVNLVNVDNSSESLGMAALPPGSGYVRLRAPGLPGSKKKGTSDSGAASEDSAPGYDTVDIGAGLSEAQKIRKRLAGGKQVVHDHVQAHAHGRRGLAHRVAHQHGHGH